MNLKEWKYPIDHTKKSVLLKYVYKHHIYLALTFDKIQFATFFL